MLAIRLGFVGALLVLLQACGGGGASNPSPSGPDTTPPTEPQGLSVLVDGSSRLQLNWSGSTDAGGSGLAGYHIYRNGSASASATVTSPGYTDTGLAAMTQYSYSVRAYDNAGNESPAALGQATTADAMTPPATDRYLRDQSGQPFPILGRASWYVMSLPVSAYQAYLSDTLGKGFNSIEVKALMHDPGAHNAPFAGDGSLPFMRTLGGTTAWKGSLTYSNINSDAPDFTAPNEVYWSYVDAFIDYCASQGIMVFMFPSYVGYLGIQQGWMNEMVANGAARMQTYGAWVANRYKDRSNIVWMLGGDAGTGANSFNAAQTAVEQALLDGMRSVVGQKSIQWSAEWNTESIATDQVSFGSAMTLNGAYSFEGKTAVYGRNAYAHSPVSPAFLLEEPYDETDASGTKENTAASPPVRRFLWWGWLSSIGGYIAGNGYVWRFNDGYVNHLNVPGALDLKQLNAFVRSIAWWQLVPSGLGGMKNLVTAGGYTPPDAAYVAAAANASGTLLVAYVPPAHTGSITVDMTALSASAQAQWLNPTTSAVTAIGTFPNTGTQVFTPPGDNGSGFADWVLVLRTP